MTLTSQTTTLHRRATRVLLTVVTALSVTAIPLDRLSAQSVSDTAGVRYAKANAKTIPSYIVLLRLRGDLLGRWRSTGVWPKDSAANAALSGHGAYWQERLKEGTAMYAGGMQGNYWDNVAFIVFEAPSQEEAEYIVAGDPAVSAFVFEAQVRPLDVHFVSDKYFRGR